MRMCKVIGSLCAAFPSPPLPSEFLRGVGSAEHRLGYWPYRGNYSGVSASIIFYYYKYSRTSLFRTRLIRSPRYFEGTSNALGFTLPLYASPVISKPRYFELFFISLGTSK